MSFLYWTNQVKHQNKPPHYNASKDHIITYNVSGKIFSFSYLTLSKYRNSNLYSYAYEMPSNKLILDKDNFIYLDLSSDIFQYIHDYIKGYDIRLQDINIKTKEMILRDAKLLNLQSLADIMVCELPSPSKELLNKWANIVTSTLLKASVNIESMVESCTGNKLEYPLTEKIKTLFETNPVIRNKIKKCVTEILEVQYTNKNNVDSLILQVLLELSKDMTFQDLIESILGKYL